MKMKKDTEIKTPRKSTINNNSEKLIFVRFERDLNQVIEHFEFDITQDLSFDQSQTLLVQLGFINQKNRTDLSLLVKVWELIQEKKKQNKKTDTDHHNGGGEAEQSESVDAPVSDLEAQSCSFVCLKIVMCAIQNLVQVATEKWVRDNYIQFTVKEVTRVH